MKKIIFYFLLISLNLILVNCTTLTNSNEKNNILNSNQFKDINNFLDLIIQNSNNIDSVIIHSNYYDKEFTDLHFYQVRFYKIFENLCKNYYKIDEINYFNINQLDKFTYIDQIHRYPNYESDEFTYISHILNIYIIPKGFVRDMKKNNGALVFTFCQKYDGTWYLRIIENEYVIL